MEERKQDPMDDSIASISVTVVVCIMPMASNTIPEYDQQSASSGLGC